MGVPVQIDVPVTHVHPVATWQVVLDVLASHATGVPRHEAVLDHAQLLAARQDELAVLVEQAAAVPAQTPVAVFHEHPRSAAHMVLLTLDAQGDGVPLQARVALLQVHPGCVEHVVMLVLRLQALGVPMQAGPDESVQVQPVCATHAADVAWVVHG